MDSHHVGRKRRSLEWALQQVKARTIVISVSSDLLFPPDEQRLIAQHIPNAQWRSIDSIYGHDGFLTETAALAGFMDAFLQGQTPLVLSERA